MSEPKDGAGTVLQMLPGAGQADKLADLVKHFRRTMALQIEIEQIQAKLTRAKFTALMEEGFTEAQALELCRNK